MPGRRGAHFDTNPVRDVFLVSSSPSPQESWDGLDDAPTPCDTHSTLPGAPKPRTVSLPEIFTPHVSSTSLPELPEAASIYPSPSLSTSPQEPSTSAFSTPSPTSNVVHLHPALEAFTWDPRGDPPSVVPSKRGSPATEPPFPKLVLSSSHLPWLATVDAPSTAVAVTVGDVLDSLEDFFRTTVTRAEWDAVGNMKDRIRQTFKSRCADDDKERAKGLRRVDYLPEGAVISGLGKYPGGKEEELTVEVVVPSAR